MHSLNQAEAVYAKHNVIGSDEKTVRGEEHFKIIGAEVFSDKLAKDAGVIVVGAPATKRIPMICLSFKLAELPIISRALASRAAGNWVSIFMCRKSLCCLLSEIFSFGTKSPAILAAISRETFQQVWKRDRSVTYIYI